ncbi:DNA breaking-rejoining enzyme, partial [Mycena pura]
CDTLDCEGQPVPKDRILSTYGTAAKIRAALSYKWGRVKGVGKRLWGPSPSDASNMLGNPIMSEEVADYMPSLRRRKVAAGEISRSSRAMTQEIFLARYNYFTGLAQNSPDCWCGPTQYLQIQCFDTLGFQCLLRSAEILRIRMEDIEFLYDSHGKPNRASLTLRTRKTSPYGEGIKPFIIWRLPPHEAHLCPFRALCYWIHASRITSGYLFRNVNKWDQVSRLDKHMVILQTSRRYLEILRHTLLDIKIDPTEFGTHLLRRGGVYYFYIVKGYNIQEICLWGGWSTDYNISSVWRYIVSIMDDEKLNRVDFLNPDYSRNRCFSCGRTN